MFAQVARYPVSPEQLSPLDRTAGSYRLRFGRGPEDLAAVQRLRFAVFNRELGEGLATSWNTGLDADPWDELFHHIVIEHVPSGEVVGSYRLQTGDMPSSTAASARRPSSISAACRAICCARRSRSAAPACTRSIAMAG
jgi:putative hemolysin